MLVNCTHSPQANEPQRSQISTAATVALDVRDKADLAAFRSARKRDVILWRVALGCAAAFALLLVGELALVGGKEWQKVRVAKQNARQAIHLTLQLGGLWLD